MYMRKNNLMIVGIRKYNNNVNYLIIRSINEQNRY